MKCSKCNYVYANDIPACPLCGEPNEARTEEALQPQQEQKVQPQPEMQQAEMVQQAPPQPGMQQAPQQYQYQQQYQQAPQPPQYGAYGQQLPLQDDLSGARSSATGALVCGILGMFIPFVGIVLSIVALVLGNSAKKKLPEHERGMATAGFVLGIVGLVLSIFYIVLIFALIGMAVTLSSQVMQPFNDYYGQYGQNPFEYFSDPSYWY